MYVIRLGVINAWRNRHRSAAAAVGMGLAAALAVISLSLSAGYPARAALEYRRFVGGDVIIYASGHLVGETAVTQADPSAGAIHLKYQRLSHDEVSHLAAFQPGLYVQGDVMAPSAGWLDAQAVAGAAGADPGVRAVYPTYVLPAIQATGEARYKRVLRGRDLDLDREVWRFDRRVVAGRYFTGADRGRMVAVVDARGAELGLPVPAVGETITLELPALRFDAAGRPRFDYTRTRPVTLEVVGQFALPTRWVNLATGDVLGGEAPNTATARQLYWATPEILVPRETWLQLYRLAAGPVAVRVPEAAVIVRNLALVENVARRLGAVFPGRSVISTVRQTRIANAQGRPERAADLAAEVLASAPYAGPALAVPLDLRLLTVGLTYGIASLLMVANFLVVVTGRRREIAILKAVGGKGREILAMVLTEVLVVSALGVLAGFAAIQVLVSINFLASQFDLAGLLALTAGSLGRLLLVTAAFALVFGLVPAWRAARLTVMDVLRTG